MQKITAKQLRVRDKRVKDVSNRLANFVDKHSTIDGFAADVGCSPSHLRNIIAGRRQPSVTLLGRIVERTNGRVNIKAFAA
jgi:hypothetical protein